jgi:hypothetical protein
MINNFLKRVNIDMEEKKHIEELIDEEKEEMLEKHCPFTPQLSNMSRQLAMQQNYKPIHQRYKKVLKKKQRKLEEMRLRKIDDELEELEDSPVKSIDDVKDLYKADMEWLEKKNKRLLNKRAEMLGNELKRKRVGGLKINKKSRQLFKGTTFEQRQKVMNVRKAQRKELVEEDMFKNCTYTPRINDNTEKILQKSLMRKYKSVRQEVKDLWDDDDGYKTTRGNYYDPDPKVSTFLVTYEDFPANDQEIIEVYDGGRRVGKDVPYSSAEKPRAKTPSKYSTGAIQELLQSDDEGFEMFKSSRNRSKSPHTLYSLTESKTSKKKKRRKKKPKRVYKLEDELDDSMKKILSRLSSKSRSPAKKPRKKKKKFSTAKKRRVKKIKKLA